jgi:urease alpha subunit
MNFKKTLAVVLTGGMLLSGVAAYAATNGSTVSVPQTKQYSTEAPRYGMSRNADFLAKLTGKTADEILNELKAGKTMVQIAEENGITLDSLKKAMIEQREAYIDQLVKEGKLTQERATFMKQNMEKRMNSWDGTCQYGKGSGLGLGMGYGKSNADKMSGFGQGFGAKGQFRGGR